MNVDNRQAVPLPGFVNPGSLCSTPSIGATIGSGGQYAVGVNIPLFTHPKDCRPNTERERIDRCIQYLQAGITVSSFKCDDVQYTAVREPIIVQAPPAAVLPPVVVTRVVKVERRAQCVTMSDREKHLILAEIHKLRKTKQADIIAADLKSLRAACVSDKEIANAIDG